MLPNCKHVSFLYPIYALIFTNTPAGTTNLFNASTVRAFASKISISRLCVRISNCSRDFLSTCGLLNTVYRSTRVGSGTGPLTRAFVLRAWSTISLADVSRERWSYASILIRIRSVSVAIQFYTSKLILRLGRSPKDKENNLLNDKIKLKIHKNADNISLCTVLLLVFGRKSV